MDLLPLAQVLWNVSVLTQEQGILEDKLQQDSQSEEPKQGENANKVQGENVETHQEKNIHADGVAASLVGEGSPQGLQVPEDRDSVSNRKKRNPPSPAEVHGESFKPLEWTGHQG